jgi:hydroxymethylglutaryl-CoA synthase
MNKVGIDAIDFYTSNYYLDLAELAKARGIDVDKFYIGLGQQKMSVPAPDEDIVTMGANAAQRVMRHANSDDIDTVLFATESSIDQSKAAGVYVHQLLGLSQQCRVVELKQACYSATAALQMAVALAARNPSKKILLIASDIARYGLGAPAEATQGCGAVAMLISVDPRLLEIEPEYGVYTSDVMDFWRPNYCNEAFVEGKYSTKVYFSALEQAWKYYQEKSGRSFNEHDFYCYHTPVSRMIEKAHKLLAKINGITSLSAEQIKADLENSLHYSRIIGNSYTASLYISLISLLDNNKSNLADKRVGFYSYGSGCVAEYFSGVVQKGYRKVLDTAFNKKMLKNREALTIEAYEAFYNHAFPIDGSELQAPQNLTGKFRLSGIKDHKRIYAEAPVKQKRKRACVVDDKVFVVKARSPGKIILSGEYGVVHGGPALAMAVDRFAETTVSPQLSKMISFHLLTFRFKESFTIQTLREVKHRLGDKYQQFLDGNCGIRDVLQTPFELAQFTFINLLDHFNSKIIDGLNIQTKSDIPIGCGMGSSAASVLSVLYAISRYCKFSLNKEKSLQFGFESERLQHGYPSGIDLHASLNGGCVYFQDGNAQERSLPQVPMYMVNTGVPECGTGECVEQVKKNFTDSDAIWKDFATVTNGIDTALKENNTSILRTLIQENHKLLAKIGVVPGKIKDFICDIEQMGAAAKICGAGAVRGNNAGVVLITGDEVDGVVPVCQRYGYELTPIKGESQGLHVV